MYFIPYIFGQNNNARIEVTIESATPEDISATHDSPVWQTDWDSEYLASQQADIFALKTLDHELVALAAYQVRERAAYVYILYMESAPSSNPTMNKRENRKYYGIGEALFAFGIKYSIDHGFRGTIIFHAKTSELADTYRERYHALQLPSGDADGPVRFMLADAEAWSIFSKYLFEEEAL